MDETKAERTVQILLYLLGNKGRQVVVKNVMDHLGLGEDERQNVQRDLRLLAAMPETGVEVQGTIRDKSYRISRAAERAIGANRPLGRDDLFTFLLLSRIQEGMLRGGADRIKVFEDLLDKSLEIAAPLTGGRNIYRDLSARFGDLVLFAGEEIAAGPNSDLVPTLFRSLLERRKIQVEYEAMTDGAIPSKHILEPWRLLVFRGELYFVCPKGGKRDALYTYKLARIRKASLLEESFKIDLRLMERFRKKLDTGVGLYSEESDVPRRVKLSFPWAYRHNLRERKVHRSQKVQLDSQGERVLVTLDVPLNEDLLKWIRDWGDAVEVVEPIEVKQKLLGYAEYLRETYA
jgi:predicted DNA-binding transcriptional regulator YafY